MRDHGELKELAVVYARGTEWRKWDLHVHTPSSIHHSYGGTDPWDRYLTELSQLPPDIAVIGINDYWFLDGYSRVRSEFQSGRFPNLAEIFPIIEVRTENFGGVDGKLRRINLHFVCDPLLTADVIDKQLLSCLKPRYRLTSGSPDQVWSQVITPTSLAELGAEIKRSVPPEELPKYKSDLIEGFNNACISLEDGIAAVRNNSALTDHVLLAVGKTEWQAIKWNDQSVASKKTLINSADLVFVAAETREAFAQARESLVNANVNSRLFDCSDAHTWRDSRDKDRLGNSFTWINADVTFKGLRHAIQEYDHRVTADVRPGLLERVATRPNTVITKVAVRPVATSRVQTRLFDSEVELNPGFVVILGNKGQGKSALLDCMAAAANCDRQDDYSFLTEKRFRRKNGEAQNYQASLVWADGASTETVLSDPFVPRLPVKIDYLPQSLIERVCLADPYSKQERQFEREIERVVFGHIPAEERGDATSLQQFLAHRSDESLRQLDKARTRIVEAIRELTRLDDRKAELEELDLDGRATQLMETLVVINASIADAELKLADLDSDQIATENRAELELASAEVARIQEERLRAKQAIRAAESRRQSAQKLRVRLLDEVSVARSTADVLAQTMGDPALSLARLEFDEGAFSQWLSAQETQVDVLRSSVEDPEVGLEAQIGIVRRRIDEITELLRQRSQGSDAILKLIQDLKVRRDHVMGEPAKPDSLRGVEALIEERNAIPVEEGQAIEMLRAAFLEAHSAAMAVFAIQRAAYASATDFVASNDLADQVGLEFDVELRVRGFTNSWSDKVNKQRLTDMQEIFEVPGKELLLDGVDLNDGADLFRALREVQDRLGRNRGDVRQARRRLSSVVRSSYSASTLLAALYDLKWLEGEYVIRSDGQELSELSPGQRGLALLVFYLLIDKSEKPLFLDQPEENLDNQTVRNLLIPALRAAIKRRQVVVVTHNPNLAIVGDADQLIVASMKDGTFVYRSGSLAEHGIGSQSIDVLEGTRAAFDNREAKYDHVVGRA